VDTAVLTIPPILRVIRITNHRRETQAVKLKSTIAAAAALTMPLTGMAGSAMATCPAVTITGNVNGAPVWSHTGPARFVFFVDGDPQLYALPIGGFPNAAGEAIAGVNDPKNCLVPLAGRSVMANQIVGLVTTNNLIEVLNNAFHVSMPLLTVSFDVSTDTLHTDDGDGLIVYDHDQRSETQP